MTQERYDKILNVINRRQYSLTVILEDIIDDHNISAVMRSCDAVGIQDVYAIKTGNIRKVKPGRRSSSSARNWVTLHQFTSTEECFAEVRKRFDKIYTTHLSSGAKGLYDMDFTQSIALVFGNETFGCSETAVSLADGNFLIPQQGIIQSLNISVACAVTLYEAYRQRNAAGMYDTKSLPDEQINDLKEEWGLNLFERIK